MKKGFTLVELSIVLVIIGLLIGGVLAAQSMINTAKIQKTIRQLTQYDVALTNFQMRYNQIPGDSNLFTGIGDRDGQINGVDNAEMGTFWADLSLGTGLKNAKGTNYVAFTKDDPMTELNCPRFNLDQDITDPPCLLVRYDVVLQGNYYNYYARRPPWTFTGCTYDPLKPTDAFAIDQKFDDGKPTTGNIFAAFTCDSSPGSCWVGSPPTYNITDNIYRCSIAIKLGSINRANY